MTAETARLPRRCRASETFLPVLRAALTLSGSLLALSAFGLWLTPGTVHTPELMPIRLGLSLFLLIGGLCCVHGGRNLRG